MERTVLRLAELSIAVEHLYPRFDAMSAYLAPDSAVPDFTVTIDAQDLVTEQQICEAQCRHEGIVCPPYSAQDYESTAIYRKIAQHLPSYDAIIFHGSAVAVGDEAYLFAAPSGTGKTTHSRLWLEHIADSYIVNGDKPILRITPHGVMVCGTPWAGKENLGINRCVPLKAICWLDRAKENTIEPVPFAAVLPRMIGQVYRSPDRQVLADTLRVLDNIGKQVAFYRLGCNMQSEAATVAYEGMR